VDDVFSCSPSAGRSSPLSLIPVNLPVVNLPNIQTSAVYLMVCVMLASLGLLTEPDEIVFVVCGKQRWSKLLRNTNYHFPLLLLEFWAMSSYSFYT
jgi:hypothetical protein